MYIENKDDILQEYFAYANIIADYIIIAIMANQTQTILDDSCDDITQLLLYSGYEFVNDLEINSSTITFRK